MRKTLFVLGCLVVFGASSVQGYILSPTAQVEGILAAETTTVFVGKTTLSGSFSGVSLDQFISTTEFESFVSSDITAFPLLGPCRLTNLDSVRIIDANELSGQDIDDIIGPSYSQVTLSMDAGFFLLGATEGAASVDTNIEYAVTSQFSFELTEGNPLPVLIVLATTPITLQYSGQDFILTALGEGSNIQLEDQTGAIIWDEDITNKLFIIDDEAFSVIPDAAFNLFPLATEGEQSIELTITPADAGAANLSHIIQEVTQTTSSFGDMDMSELSGFLEGFDAIISAAESVLNGAMILIETTDMITIDDSPQNFSRFGFARINQFHISIAPETQYLTINGSAPLVFLGDHFYTAMAKESDSGVVFPVAIVIVWIIAIILFLYLRFYYKKEINEERDQKLKRYALIFHIALIIVAFILLDREMSYQFGTSAIDALLGQGLSLLLVIFLLVELGMWGLGYVVLAIPVRLITASGLRLYGIGKGGKGFAKGVGLLFIWVFGALYVKLILNIILSMFNPGNFLFPMG